MSLPVEAPLYVHGIGHFHPENEIDNDFLRDLGIGTDPEWILERVGIRSRRTVMPLEYIKETKNAHPTDAGAVSVYSNAETGARAAKMALERAGIQPKDVGCIVMGGCSPQSLAPAEACLVAAELGLQCPSFDLNSACSTFAAQIHILRSMRPEALPDYVLVVVAENNTRTVDYSDRGTAVLWGDGSAAAVVSLKIHSPVQISNSVIDSDPSGWNKVRIPTGGHFTQQGSQVQAFAIRKTLSTLRLLQNAMEGEQERLYFIGHQANLLMLNAVGERGGINRDRHLFNVDRYGNCGAAGAPSVLSQNWERFTAGDELAMVVVGSGLTWGGLLFRWTGSK